MQSFAIGIVGVGSVGGALRRYFEGSIGERHTIDPKTGLVAGPAETRGAEIVPERWVKRNPALRTRPRLFLYDKFKALGSPEEVNKAEVIFLCVPTPYSEKNGFDRSAVEEACGILKGNKIVVIKSTVLPGTTEYFQKKYPRHKLLFNPEFLTEATADADMRYPDRQIMGYTAKSYGVAKDVLALLPLAPFERIIPATEAEMVKYFNNTWFTAKVIFANQIYDLCEKIGINYDVVKECAAADKRIGRSHLEVWHKGYRGVRGACLPKDTQSLIEFAAKQGVDLKLLKTALAINEKLLKAVRKQPAVGERTTRA